MKFVRPLYRAMFKNPATSALAVKTFQESAHVLLVVVSQTLTRVAAQENRSFYNIIAAKMINQDLELSKTPAAQ